MARIPKLYKVKEADNLETGEVILYRAKDGKTWIDVRLENETVWLTQKQIAELFGTKRPAITKHLSNIFNVRELQRNSVCSKMEHTAADGKKYQTQYYNLDAVISVGYRVNSARATQFRIWATQILKDHLVKGYSLNERRLKMEAARFKELQQALGILSRVVSRKELQAEESAGLLKVITGYSRALNLLDAYDHGTLALRGTTLKKGFRLTYEKAREAVDRLGAFSDAAGRGLFGREKDQSFKSSIRTIYQTFGGKELYPSVEEKAAHLLYFVIKNHSFVDGNKRIAAFLFVWFLDANGCLYREGEPKLIQDNTLVALALLIAESDPKEKDTIVKVVVNLMQAA